MHEDPCSSAVHLDWCRLVESRCDSPVLYPPGEKTIPHGDAGTDLQVEG